MSKKFYVTTAIAYVNAKPHVGFALESLQADAYARYHRMEGQETYFLTGTDEHGTKIAEMAKKQGKEPQVLCDEVAEVFRSMKPLLNLSNNDFIRTTDRKKHWPSVAMLWQKLVAKGDLYKKNYQGYYCVGCEAFVTASELVNGECAIHHKKPVPVEEENYFFRLSKYGAQIEQLIESDQLKILPVNRKKEILNFIKKGLQDISFSRSVKALQWGIPVPGDDTQVMYVWCDALVNYISALDYAGNGALYQKFWADQETFQTHIVGKDILRFHAAFWPAMLMSAELPLPKQILVHGFVTSGGQKMSKSLGNVIDPFEMQKKYGTEALRYYLLKEIPSSGDGDFSETHFCEVFEADLANNLGNLVSRVLTLAINNEVKFEVQAMDFKAKIEEMWRQYDLAFENFELNKAMEALLGVLREANLYIAQEKPWVLVKENRARMELVLYNMVEVIRQAALAIYPFLPTTAEKIMVKLGYSNFDFNKIDLAQERTWGNLKAQPKLEKGENLFPRLVGKE